MTVTIIITTTTINTILPLLILVSIYYYLYRHQQKKSEQRFPRKFVRRRLKYSILKNQDKASSDRSTGKDNVAKLYVYK